MIEAAQVEVALAEAARLLSPLCVERGDEGHFLVSFAAGESVELIFDERTRCLTFMSEVGRLDEGRAATTQRLLLEYNFLHQATGGIAMALNSVSGQVVQIFRWPVGHLSVPELATLLKNFNHRTNVWREAVAAGLGSGSDAEEALSDEFDIHSAIRV